MKDNELIARHESEKQYHDEWYKKGPRKDFYSIGYKSIIFEDFLRQLGDIEGKDVLEYGCGVGWLTKILAERGARVWSFDISHKAILGALKFNADAGVSHLVNIVVMAAEELAYKESFFDIAVGNAILHHLKPGLWIPELHRVLKPGGKGYFMEPLAHNPGLNLFRVLTPGRRSSDEKPLSVSDMKEISGHFSGFKHQEYYLFALLAMLLYPLRYDKLTLSARNVLHGIDMRVLKLFPALSRYCWYTIFEVQK